MSNKIVFLLEEPSMKEFLNGFLPKLLGNDCSWLCIAHQGKGELKKSIPRKLRAWKEPGVRFVVICDQDNGDCFNIKQDLKSRCNEGRRPETLIRIACRELESWFLGNLQAVADAFVASRLAKLQGNEKYRNPDQLQKPSSEIKRLVPDYQKISGARAIGRHLSVEGNRSKSFNVFVNGNRGLSDQ